MTVKKSTIKNITIISSAIFFGIAVLMFVGSNKPISKTNNGSNQQISNTPAPQIIDGKQIAEITANFNGYQPGVVELKSGIPTIIKINSVNNFGCGSAFRIPKLGVNMSLPINGVNEVDLGTQAAGTTIDGMCSMGMYKVKFKFV